MRKYLSLIGVLLVLVVFYLGPKAEAQFPYVSPALLLGINLTIATVMDSKFISPYPYKQRLML